MLLSTIPISPQPTLCGLQSTLLLGKLGGASRPSGYIRVTVYSLTRSIENMHATLQSLFPQPTKSAPQWYLALARLPTPQTLTKLTHKNHNSLAVHWITLCLVDELALN